MLINPGNPAGTLDVYRFVITCSNINAGDDDDDSNDNKISLFTLDILLAHRLLRSSFLFTGDPYQGVFVIPGCWLYRRSFYRGVVFSPFFDEFLLILGCSLSRQLLN